MEATANTEDKKLMMLLEEHKYLRKLDTPNKLLLIQGIDLIDNGLQMIEWVSGVLSPNAYDSLTILRDRAFYFKDCVFDEIDGSHLIIDRAKKHVESTARGLQEKKTILKLLEELRKLNVTEFHKEYEEQTKELINLAKKELSK